MACERFRDALADVAAGGPAPVAVEAHLASCEACRAELQVLRQALAMADAAMDGLAAAEPSPELAARIRHGAAEARADGPALDRGAALGWRFGWVWPAMAAVATILVALAVALGRGTTPVPGPRVAVDAAPTQSTDRAPVAEPSGEAVLPWDSDLRGPGKPAVPGLRETGRAEGPSIRRPTGAPRSHKAALPHEPEVLVPPGEGEALLRLVALVHRDRLAPTSLAAAGQPSADLAELASIDIKPLEIVPLDLAGTPGT